MLQLGTFIIGANMPFLPDKQCLLTSWFVKNCWLEQWALYLVFWLLVTRATPIVAHAQVHLTAACVQLARLVMLATVHLSVNGKYHPSLPRHLCPLAQLSIIESK